MVSSQRNGRVFLGGMVLLLTVASCGSDGDRLSEAEFFAQANEICRVGNAALDETIGTFETLFPAGTEPTDEEVQQVLEENGQAIVDDIVSNVRGQIAEIRDLKAPSDLEVQFGHIFDEALNLWPLPCQRTSAWFGNPTTATLIAGSLGTVWISEGLVGWCWGWLGGVGVGCFGLWCADFVRIPFR